MASRQAREIIGAQPEDFHLYLGVHLSDRGVFVTLGGPAERARAILLCADSCKLDDVESGAFICADALRHVRASIREAIRADSNDRRLRNISTSTMFVRHRQITDLENNPKFDWSAKREARDSYTKRQLSCLCRKPLATSTKRGLEISIGLCAFEDVIRRSHHHR